MTAPDVVTVPDSGVTEGPPSTVVDGMIGTWATRTRTLTEQTVPVLGMVRTTSSAYGIVVFARAGAGVTLTEPPLKHFPCRRRRQTSTSPLWRYQRIEQYQFTH